MTHDRSRSSLWKTGSLAVGVFLSLVLTPQGAFGQLRFEAVSNALTAAPFGASGSAWIDVDGDGFTDVAIAARDSMPNRVFRHRRGTFESVHLPNALNDANAAAWGDIDGDGDPDLALALQDGIGLYETRTSENGFELAPFTASGVIASDLRPRGSHDAIALGDLDADGDLDMVVAAYGSGGVQVLANDGSGAFTTLPRDQFPFAARLGGAHIVDLDADGRPDLLFSGAPANLFRVGTFVYWNDAQSWTADRETAFAEHAGGLGSSVADVDQDGDLDVFVAGWREDTPSALYLNEGRRTFRRSPIPFPARVVGSGFADFDGDGRLDLVTSSGYGDVGRIELWIGDGNGGFASLSVPGLTDVAGRYSGLSVVDYDRDGRLDLHVNSMTEPSRLFRNVSDPSGSWVQIELRPRPGGIPIMGARVDFEVQSAAVTWRSSVTLHQQSGFGGHGDPVAHLALPSGARVRTVSVRWPGGALTQLQELALGARVLVEAPRHRTLR